MTPWTSDRALLSMTLEVPCEADALSVGRAVARALDGADAATVEAAPI